MTVTLTNADFTISRPAPEREQDIVAALNPAPDATADLPTALTRVGFQIDHDRHGTIRIVGGEVNPSASQCTFWCSVLSDGEECAAATTLTV
jgi:hypothetical protein